MRFKHSLLALSFVMALAGQAQAAPIDYIFTGTGNGTLNGTAFSGNFTVTYVGDTTGVTFAGEYFNDATAASFSTSALSANITGFTEVVLNTDPSSTRVGFGDIYGPPSVVSVEAVQNSALASYNLATAFPLVANGSASAVAPAVFQTNVGDLDFTTISSLDFQAVLPTSAVPLPTSMPLFVTAFLGLGAFGFMRRRQA